MSRFSFDPEKESAESLCGRLGFLPFSGWCCYIPGMKSFELSVNLCWKLLRLGGWTVGDVSLGAGWIVDARRREQRIIVKADSQEEAWNEVVRQTRANRGGGGSSITLEKL